jgi:predicted glycosyltransferase
MKPGLLLYCQHSLGLGHFVRSLALAEAMAEHFAVTFFNGGPVPEGIVLPDCIRFVHLPPLRMQEDGSIAGEGDVGAILAERRDRMLTVAREAPAAVLVVELYPFGRKKFAVEIDPLIDLVRQRGGRVACSVRDVLVTDRADQSRHDDRAAQTLAKMFDCVLVHTDPRLFVLTDSFQPQVPMKVPVEHTGYVVRSRSAGASGAPDGPTLVAAGGGAVGHALYAAAIDAQSRLKAERGWDMVLVAGPLLPEADWSTLCERTHGVAGLTLLRSVPSMVPLLAASGRFAGQCGYNSALEVCQAGLPALFVPFARGRESEQTARAIKLREVGLADWMPEQGLTGEVLAKRLGALQPPTGGASLDLDGARKSARLLQEMVSCTV